MKKVSKQDLANALKNLVVRFPLEGFAVESKLGACKCNQYQDNGECRHTIAVETLNKFENEVSSEKQK